MAKVKADVMSSPKAKTSAKSKTKKDKDSVKETDNSKESKEKVKSKANAGGESSRRLIVPKDAHIPIKQEIKNIFAKPVSKESSSSSKPISTAIGSNVQPEDTSLGSDDVPPTVRSDHHESLMGTELKDAQNNDIPEESMPEVITSRASLGAPHVGTKESDQLLVSEKEVQVQVQPTANVATNDEVGTGCEDKEAGEEDSSKPQGEVATVPLEGGHADAITIALRHAKNHNELIRYIEWVRDTEDLSPDDWNFGQDDVQQDLGNFNKWLADNGEHQIPLDLAGLKQYDEFLNSSGQDELKKIFDSKRSERMGRLSTLFEWPGRDVSALASCACESMMEHIPYMKHLCSLMESVTISTSFSGIDAPCTAMGMLQLGTLKCIHGEELGKVLEHNDPMRHWRCHNLWACEWDNSAQGELLRHPACPKCLFSDISLFWLHSVQTKIPSLLENRKTISVLMEQCRSQTGVKLDAYCQVHQRNCTVSWIQWIHIFICD